MKITEGVNLHFIKTEKFKTNHLTFRFSSPLVKQTLAKRALVADILEKSSLKYQNTRKIREKLADLYGATLTTSVWNKGQVNIVDIDISFISSHFLKTEESNLEKIITFLSEILFNPFIILEKFDTKMFEMIKKNALRYQELDLEDPFYYSELELDSLFFEKEELHLPQYGSREMLDKENAYTVYQEFKRMLDEDRIDIFLLGRFDERNVQRLFKEFPLKSRQVHLSFFYQQDYTNITNEKIETKDINQSILQIGYSVSKPQSLIEKYSLLLFNSMLGAYPHSRLFTEVRQKEALAYTIGSDLNIFLGSLYIYTSIDSFKRNDVIRQINREINLIKLGRFSSDFLSQIKHHFIAQEQISLDDPKVLIERMYNKNVLQEPYDELSILVDTIDKICKEDIVSVARKIKLKSIYFMSGGDFE